MKIVAFLVLTLSLARAAAVNLDSCRVMEHHGKSKESTTCFQALAGSPDPLVRAEALFGLRKYKDANDAFREAERAQPQSALVKTEWGKLFLAKSQAGDAAALFGEALKLEPKYAPAYLELARATAGNYDKASVEFSRKALESDPQLFQAHEFLAYLALEDSDRKGAESEAKQAITQSSEALDGMSVLASMDWLDGKSDSAWMDRIRAVDPVYGEAYAMGAHFLVINRRYDEGIALYRKALTLNPSLAAARSQLGLNLMRLGEVDEARHQLEQCYTENFRDAQTVNALRLLDRLPEYQTIKLPMAELVLSKKEASLLQPYFSAQLTRAMATYERKYQLKLPGPVRVEVFPNHEDLMVRTLGLPGQGGLLGVTFGTVLAMDSPSARPPGDFSWTETLWHELSHVYVLTATHQLVPRWFTEGVAVHEERASSPAGSDRVTPMVLSAIHQNKLLPVLELERGFVRPEYDGQVLVSYFEAGRMCDYIVDHWGDNALVGMMHTYAARKTTADALEENLHLSPQQFDIQFRAWLAGHLPPKPEEPPSWDSLKQRAGNDLPSLERLNYVFLEDAAVHQHLGNTLLAAARPEEAVQEFRAVIALQDEATAEAHYDLARALNAAHQTAAAKDQVLIALETAPNYKPAQQLLLKLSQ